MVYQGLRLIFCFGVVSDFFISNPSQVERLYFPSLSWPADLAGKLFKLIANPIVG